MSKSHLEKTIFFDEPVEIARYEKVKYPLFDGLTDTMLGFFWRPEEVDLTKDGKDHRGLLSQIEKRIFALTLKRQIVLDTKQGAAPSKAFGPIVSLPEVETYIQTWTWNETIHSRTYTHIIRNVYSDPSKIFDEVLDELETRECVDGISKYYDELIHHNAMMECNHPNYDLYAHKTALWLALNAVNALEGIRFYASFAVSWNFAEQKKMEGNAALIKLIARDENLHLSGTQNMLRILPIEDADFKKIREECENEVLSIYLDTVNQEKAFAKLLFRDGAMLGLNETILCNYIEWVANKRMLSVKVKSPFKTGPNPLPWTEKWIAGHDVQVAPQEVSVVSYKNNQIYKDLEDDTFKGFTL